MKKNLIIGIDPTTNIDELLQDGIRQFYFGYISSDYLDTYSTQTSLNRRYRQKEQFLDLDAIKITIDKIHQQNGIIYLALNSFTSNEIMLSCSKELYDIFEDTVDGMIVANITIASMLKKQNYKKIVISNLFGVYTTDAVEFLKSQFDPMKIILPRDISLANIKTIVLANLDTDFECFLYGDNCRFSESFCFSEHGYDSVGFGSLCSYSANEKVLIKSALPTYKQIVKNPKYLDDEKKQMLKKEDISIDSLLEDIALNLFEFDSKKISKDLELLCMYDIDMFTGDKKLYIKTINTLEKLDFTKAQELLEGLKDSGIQEPDKYKIFHNLNTSAILQTVEFFKQYPNITSYKIPSRGRNFYKYLDSCEDEPYNYKQSQYKL